MPPMDAGRIANSTLIRLLLKEQSGLGLHCLPRSVGSLSNHNDIMKMDTDSEKHSIFKPKTLSVYTDIETCGKYFNVNEYLRYHVARLP